jgi:hypothetical protein
MSHADTADKLLIKPAAGARPAPPHTRGQIIPKARTRRPVTRRVTRGTATTRLAAPSDRPTRRVLPSPERGGTGLGLTATDLHPSLRPVLLSGRRASPHTALLRRLEVRHHRHQPRLVLAPGLPRVRGALVSA